jgi:hypothetical protein
MLMNREERLSQDLVLSRGDVEGLRTALTLLKIEYAKLEGGNERIALSRIRDKLSRSLFSLQVTGASSDGSKKDFSDIARERVNAILVDVEKRALLILDTERTARADPDVSP